ncbi:ectonucleotide pyrophosphatase/phosphodiesterase family member 7-like [Asterias rubens]|uniref:ectonucleotide pyrophosphatase/phosphodiesterase family member 7-like n=1 Tax=Asterias rubens TaxID=7604 RepID=UPI001455A573|nr:ectonucleotide pyrophosphatase/phosphodiesterase family member 7-like [Asterias rubens]
MEMKKTSILLLGAVVILGLVAAEHAEDTTDSNSRHKVMLLLLDGMRADLFGEELPGLRSMEKNGVKADWLEPAYITLSMPCMYTIVTGLYPESHGITFNKYYNLTTGYKAKTFYETLNYTDWFNTPGVEPIWVTAIKQGLKAGTVQYPGGNVAIQ